MADAQGDLVIGSFLSLKIRTAAGGWHQGAGLAQHIGKGGNLGYPPVAKATNRLRLTPHFPPNAEHLALMQVASIVIRFVPIRSQSET
ncbi:MAG: hypothetical protein KGQ37_11625 [Hyphomicrobiales bacterium]|nr:hypothetical protein [Hyphomicrobiales bacterium]